LKKTGEALASPFIISFSFLLFSSLASEFLLEHISLESGALVQHEPNKMWLHTAWHKILRLLGENVNKFFEKKHLAVSSQPMKRFCRDNRSWKFLERLRRRATKTVRRRLNMLRGKILE